MANPLFVYTEAQKFLILTGQLNYGANRRGNLILNYMCAAPNPFSRQGKYI